MSDDYTKHMDDGSTYNAGDVDCKNADIVATGHFIPAPTYTAKSIKCEENAVITLTGSATVVIDKLVAKTAKLTCHSSATLRIKSIEADTITIDALDSANLRMEGGEAGSISGTVKDASYACFAGKLTGKDDVTAERASTWNATGCA